jgi:quercetin dioxygenase-like cupin family protein
VSTTSLRLMAAAASLTLASIAQAGELAKENVKRKQRRLGWRHMSIAPGGIGPLHSHEDRPALIMVNSGEIYKHSSRCAVPILHKAGNVAREHMGTQLRWKNSGTQAVDLTIGDIVNDQKPMTMEKMMWTRHRAVGQVLVARAEACQKTKTQGDSR